MARRKKKTTPPNPIGGGWYRLPDGVVTEDGKTKVQGRDAAYIAAGLDPEKNGNRRSDASKQRRRKTTIEERRLRVAAFLVRKVPVRTIGASLGVAHSTVVADVAFIRQEWRNTQARTFEDYVLEDLATLEEDEYRLRIRYESELDPKTKNATYKLIEGVMDRRRKLLGLNAPEARMVAVSVEGTIEHDVMFRAGGTKEEYVDAYSRAQGLVPA